MKIVVFTPAVLPSAIGRSTALVTNMLVEKGHDVTVVRAEWEDLLDQPTHNFGAPLLAWNRHEEVRALLEDKSVIPIYEIGNNYPYHKGCIEWLQKFAGLVCLHDFFLGELFHVWGGERIQEARSILRAWYGEKAAHEFYEYTDFTAFTEGTFNTSPMTEWVCSMASGVVAHSSWGMDRVLKSCAGPVASIALAYDTHDSKPVAKIEKSGFTVLTVGDVNANKRPASVIKAIGQSPRLRGCATYRLVGNIREDIRHQLSAAAAENGVSIVISGRASPEELNEAIGEADVISCLRWPVLESASASAIEAMLCGKPIIVTDAGFYREIPDHCALKINHDNEIAGIQEVLERLLDDVQLRRTMGDASREWAEATFSPEKYADQLVKMGVLANRARPKIAIVAKVAHYWARLFG